MAEQDALAVAVRRPERGGDLRLRPRTCSRPSGTATGAWGFESAALDLALRQSGQTLGGALGFPYRPVRFCMSTRQDARPWLDVAPGLEFKLDPERRGRRATSTRWPRAVVSACST